MENNFVEKPATTVNGKKNLVMIAVGCAFGMAGLVAIWYLSLSQNQIYIEKSTIEAPSIELSAPGGGVLQQLFVRAGDVVVPNESVAQVGGALVLAKESGTIISVRNTLGKQFVPGESVVTMIRSGDLRVDAEIEEDKGLNDVRVGQSVSFTADAFGSKMYTGVVDEVGPTARSGDVVFNISSARQEQEFDVKIRFDTDAYPELKNGMSAKAWI